MPCGRGVLLALLCLLTAAQSAPLEGDCALLELLPTDLADSISFIQPDGQAHFQGSFFVDFQKENNHNITFDVKFNTTFRFYVAGHEIDIDLWLYPINGRNAIAHSALDVAGAPEVIFGHLTPGGYRLTLFFFGDPSSISDCPAVITEMEMIPDGILDARIAGFHCPWEAYYPEIDFSVLEAGNEFHYATTDIPAQVADVLNVQTEATNFRRDVKWLTVYNFTIPRLHGRELFWQLDAAIGYQFLSGGSLGLLLVQNSSGVPNQRCYLEGQGCWLGSNIRMNEHVISQLLRPGAYQLWVFDQTGEKDGDIALPCTPFSLSLDVLPTDEEESIVNCPAKRMPLSLNGPNGIDSQGFYFFSDDVLLDLSAGQESFSFAPEHHIAVSTALESLLRVEVSESEFDIDVALFDADSGEQLAMSNRFAGYTDAIALSLSANSNYTIVLRFYGRYAPRFCETFPLDIAVAPVPNFEFCDDADAPPHATPDLSVFDSALADVSKLKRVDQGPFYVDYDTNYDAHDIYTHAFTVQEVTNVKFVLFYNFLLGGLDITLKRTDVDGADGSDMWHGMQTGNVALLQDELPQGSYTLTISTSPIQTLYKTNLTDVFPSCLRYALGFASVPAKDAADDLCWHVMKTPTDLRDLAYLGSSAYVHIADQFLIPEVPDKDEDVSITIEADVASILHVYTPARADLDMRLTLDNEKGDRVAISNSQYAEEELWFALEANEKYKLTVRFYKPRQSVPLCATYWLELLVEPMPINPDVDGPLMPLACSDTPLPSDLLTGSAQAATAWTVSHADLVLQTSDATSFDLPFTLTVPHFMRAVLGYSFASTELSLYILPAGEDAAPLASSATNGDGSQLRVTLLSPGSYILRIANVHPTALLPARCVPFSLNVSASPATFEPSLARPCTAAHMPATFNAVPYLSPISGYSLHFTRQVLVQSNGDSTTFELVAESLVRVFTSGHPAVDVDLYLYSGVPFNGTMLAVSNGFGEELLVARLSVGLYALALRYGDLPDAPPASDASACQSFMIEVAIAPMEDLLDNADITQPCSAHAPASQALQANVSYSGLQWLVPLPSNDTQRFSLEFEVADVAYLATDLRYDFLIGGLSLTLHRAGVYGAYDAEISMNHAYLRTALPAGIYTLSIANEQDAANTYGDLSFIRCGQFELDYLLNTTSDPSFCDELDVLPTDLYTLAGGSQAYGGPQSALDGSVEIYGDQFLAHRGVSEATILFAAPRDLVARFFATMGANSDLDFVLYSDVNKTRILQYSIGLDEFESSLFYLRAQAVPYMLGIKFWRVPRITCPYYRFEAVIRDNATVANDLRCPAYVPPTDRQVPASHVTLAAGERLESSSSSYVLTKSRIVSDGSGMRWTYLISLDLPGNTTLFASVLFDFLTADFRLALSGPETRLSGSPDYAEDAASELDFENRLVAELPLSGTYTLQMRFQFVNSAVPMQVPDYCFPFAFTLSLLSSADRRPSVLAVEPPSGDNLQTQPGLTIRVSFSEQYTNIVANTDFKTIAALRATNGALLAPATAVPFANRGGLRFYWAPAALAEGTGMYTLEVYAYKLTATRTGTPFANYTTNSHVYSFLACDCNGHGSCTRLNTGVLICNCTFPYAGQACQACVDGYHGAGDVCEADKTCTDALCGTHGQCDDSSGTPRCFCSDGYATTGDSYCTVCAPGYSGSPNCTLKDEATSESTLCNAPVLPVTFDTPLALRDELHIAGEYWLDADTQVHDIEFSLTRDSVLRVYAEPHWIDVDLWLFPVHPDGSNEKEIATSLGVYTEESIYVVLNGSAFAPPRYRLSLRYFIWGRNPTTPSDCETLNLEIAIAPLDTLQQQIRASAGRLCSGRQDVMPMPTQRASQPFAVPLTGMSVANTSAVYSLHATQRLPADVPHFVWSFSFTVQEQVNTEVLLQAQLDHQFLPGHLAFLLEPGNASRHCGPTGGDSRGACVPGRNAFNRNVLFTLMPAGNYTLWIYEPRPMNIDVASCTAFNFAFNITYVAVEDEDLFNCDAQRLPLSLNAPGFLSPKGFLHLADEYLIEANNAPLMLTVTETSHIRVAVSGPLPLYFYIRTEQTRNGSQFLDYGMSLHGSASKGVRLVPGSYSLQFWNWDAALSPTDGAFCVPTKVQIAVSVATHTAPITCPPTMLAARLPDLSRVRVPFYMALTRFYAMLTDRDTDASYSFVLEESAQLDVFLTSDFVTAGLGLLLQYGASKQPTVVAGEYLYNQAHLSGVFPKGNYTLKLLMPKRREGSASCVPFDFSMRVQPSASRVMPACQGDPFPLSLDTIRYLGSSFVFDYYGLYRIGLSDASSNTFTNITGFSEGNSLLHVYFDQPASVIMVGALHRIDPISGERRVVSPLLGNMVRAQLLANVTYQLELSVSRAAETGVNCITLPVQWSVAPVALWPMPTKCPTGALDHLPTMQPPTSGLFSQFDHWNYSSVATGEALYLQQNFDAPRSFSYTFTLDSLGRVYAAVGFDLRAGFLNVALLGPGNVVYLSQHMRDSSVLKAENLTPGSYTLRVEEPVPELDSKRLVCLSFTFELIIEPDYSALLIEAASSDLPITLDTVAFLLFAPSVHFSVPAMFTRPSLLEISHDPTISFHLTQRSYVRVLVEIARDFDVTVLFDGKSASTDSDNAGAKELAQGAHTITLLRTIKWDRMRADVSSMWERDVELGFELSIISVVEAGVLYSSGWVADTDTCDHHSVARIPNDVELNPDNYYGFTASRVALSPAQQQNTSTWPVYTLQFVLPVACVVYAEVTYEPAFGDVALRLIDSEKYVPSRFATVAQGTSVVHTVAPAEVYNLEIYQPSPALGADHCIPFTFRLVIHDAINSRGELVCSDFNRLPFDLNTLSGGSMIYGGPMEQGSVSLYGGEFLYPLGADSDSVRLNLDATSLVSVYINADAGLPLSAAMYLANQTEPVTPLFSDSMALTMRQLFLLQGSKVRKQAYTLTVEFPWARPLTACPYYTFALVARPLSVVQSNLLCSRSFTPQEIPTTVQLSYGFAELQITSSFSRRTDELLSQLVVNFTLTNSSMLLTSLAFDSLVFNADVVLQRLGGSSSTPQVWSRSMVRASRFRAQPYDMEERLNVPVLEPGSYSLRIRRQVFPAIPFTAARLCIPFSWFFFVAPRTGTPYILADPPSGSNIRPDLQVPFVLQLYLSSAPVDSTGAPFTYRNAHAFGGLFYLSSDSAQASIVVPNDVQASASFLTWTLHFNTLEAQTNYTLSVLPNKLFDSRQHEFRLPATASYTTGLPGCSDHGVLLVGECTCDEGYEGAYCDACADGYHEVGGDNGLFVCQPDGKCQSNSCGCASDTEPCQPLGTCDDSTGSVVCTCSGNLAGAHCEECKPGYVGYPSCVPPQPACVGKCVHGTCSDVLNKCLCADNWAGEFCDVCAPGYTGPVCEPSKTTSMPTTSTTITTTTLQPATTGPSTGVTPVPTTSSPLLPYSYTTIAEVGAAVLVVVALIVFAIVCWRQRTQKRERKYVDVEDVDDGDAMLDAKPDEKEEKTITLGKEKVAIKNRDEDDATFNPRSKNQDKMFEL